MTTVISILMLGALLGAVGYGAYVYYQRSTLPEAIRQNDVEGVERALDHGASLGPISSEGSTPLHLASQYRRKRIVQLLLERGAEPAALNGMGRTPLHAAAEAGRASIADMLLKAGADPEVEDVHGMRPIHAAAAYGSRPIVKRLVDGERAELDPRTHTGATPLHLAAFYGHLETVRSLLRRGADPAAADGQGVTPLSAARSRGHERVAELLDPKAGSGGNAAG